ncbi:hypothetical protein RRG08_011880 [Elysia crispata]|uniref:Uncharacterized protein n=1 Tax=Elysia crispata TaxID=231223 RepID=A0AAE0ZMM5_9GAST|nr:hypothetical protein RRG08_011880 [Elysia crispata]
MTGTVTKAANRQMHDKAPKTLHIHSVSKKEKKLQRGVTTIGSGHTGVRCRVRSPAASRSVLVQLKLFLAVFVSNQLARHDVTSSQWRTGHVRAARAVCSLSRRDQRCERTLRKTGAHHGRKLSFFLFLLLVYSVVTQLSGLVDHSNDLLSVSKLVMKIFPCFDIHVNSGHLADSFLSTVHSDGMSVWNIPADIHSPSHWYPAGITSLQHTADCIGLRANILQAATGPYSTHQEKIF